MQLTFFEFGVCGVQHTARFGGSVWARAVWHVRIEKEAIARFSGKRHPLQAHNNNNNAHTTHSIQAIDFMHATNHTAAPICTSIVLHTSSGIAFQSGASLPAQHPPTAPANQINPTTHRVFDICKCNTELVLAVHHFQTTILFGGFIDRHQSRNMRTCTTTQQQHSTAQRIAQHSTAHFSTHSNW